MSTQFNPPPAWPETAAENPDMQSLPVPSGWRTQVEPADVHQRAANAPVLMSEHVPASGALSTPRSSISGSAATHADQAYLTTDNRVDQTTTGFAPATESADNVAKRFKLGNWLFLTSGIFLVASTIVTFTLLFQIFPHIGD